MKTRNPLQRKPKDLVISCLIVWEIRKSRYQLTKQQIIAQEISQYCPHHKLGTDDSPLLWWKVEHSKFPNLVKLARKYLCICATSVPSKQVFSCSGHIVTNKNIITKRDHYKGQYCATLFELVSLLSCVLNRSVRHSK